MTVRVVAWVTAYASLWAAFSTYATLMVTHG